MKQSDIDQLKTEIDHIFESGANQIRVFEMVVNFIDSRNLISAQFNSSIPYYFINIEENDIKALRRIRNYFGASDKTPRNKDHRALAASPLPYLQRGCLVSFSPLRLLLQAFKAKTQHYTYLKGKTRHRAANSLKILSKSSY